MLQSTCLENVSPLTLECDLQPQISVSGSFYKTSRFYLRVNLPGTGDTVIKKAVPSGGDLCIALSQVEACDFPKRGKLGCAIFGSGGLRSRIPLHINKSKENHHTLQQGAAVVVSCILSLLSWSGLVTCMSLRHWFVICI